MTIEELRRLISAVHLDQITWSLYPPHVGAGGTVFGGHVDEEYEDGIPCRITMGDAGFDDEEALHLAVAAVNALPALLDIAEAARTALGQADCSAEMNGDPGIDTEPLRAALDKLR